MKVNSIYMYNNIYILRLNFVKQIFSLTCKLINFIFLKTKNVLQNIKFINFEMH